MAKKKKSHKKKGRDPNHLQIDENWENAVKKAIQKEKPEEGWPKEEEK